MRAADLVLAVSSETLTFTLNCRAECFPGVPTVFAVRTNEAMDTRNLPPDVTGLALKSHLQESVELALSLQPEAQEIVVLAGSGESATLAHAGKVLDQYKGRVSWRTVPELAKADLITEALRVRRGDILLPLSMMKDSAGRALSANEMARRIAAESAAPLYGVGTGVMDTGAVSGALTDFKAAGRRAANIALRVLAGEKVPVDMDESRTLTPLTVDWRALRHWKLKESRIPDGAVVMFREPTPLGGAPGVDPDSVCGPRHCDPFAASGHCAAAYRDAAEEAEEAALTSCLRLSFSAAPGTDRPWQSVPADQPTDNRNPSRGILHLRTVGRHMGGV